LEISYVRNKTSDQNNRVEQEQSLFNKWLLGNALGHRSIVAETSRVDQKVNAPHANGEMELVSVAMTTAAVWPDVKPAPEGVFFPPTPRDELPAPREYSRGWTVGPCPGGAVASDKPASVKTE
jgi:hypothetical protein